jgi:hypothetical protein
MDIPWSGAMLTARTHYEQVSLEIVKKLIEETEQTRKKPQDLLSKRTSQDGRIRQDKVRKASIGTEVAK